MSTIEVRVPQLPESVADATLVAWHKKPGDAVSRDENLVDLETDKVVLEVPAPAAGVLRELKVQNGATVTSGQVLAVLEEGAAAAAPAAQPAATAGRCRGARRSSGGRAGEGGRQRREARAVRASPGRGAQARRRRRSPGSGRDGRITKGDVLSHLAARTPARAPPAAPAHARCRRRVLAPARAASAACR